MAFESIKDLRIIQGTSQANLATKSGLTQVCVSLIEKGQRKAKIETLGALAEAFGVDVVELTIGQILESQGIALKDREAYIKKYFKSLRRRTGRGRKGFKTQRLN